MPSSLSFHNTPALATASSSSTAVTVCSNLHEPTVSSTQAQNKTWITNKPERLLEPVLETARVEWEEFDLVGLTCGVKVVVLCDCCSSWLTCAVERGAQRFMSRM